MIDTDVSDDESAAGPGSAESPAPPSPAPEKRGARSRKQKVSKPPLGPMMPLDNRGSATEE